MEGPTRVFNGRRSAFSLNFVFDPKAIDRLGLAASRAIVSAQQLSALEGASQVSLKAGEDPSIQHRFSTKGQTREWRKAREICASSRADVRGGGHFPRGAMLHWAAGAGGNGVVCSADIAIANLDRKSFSFMRSIPNFIPFPKRPSVPSVRR
jgi:hypothetical protein